MTLLSQYHESTVKIKAAAIQKWFSLGKIVIKFIRLLFCMQKQANIATEVKIKAKLIKALIFFEFINLMNFLK